jgi:hypothetical protein
MDRIARRRSVRQKRWRWTVDSDQKNWYDKHIEEISLTFIRDEQNRQKEQPANRQMGNKRV